MAKSYKNFSHQLKGYVREFNYEPKFDKSHSKVKHYIDDIDTSEVLQTEEFEKKQHAKLKKTMI